METRKLSLILIFILAACLAGAQDIIHKKSGEDIQAVIVDVSPGVIKYKKFEDQQGPVYSIAREQVDKITYQSGKIEDLNSEEEEIVLEEEPVLPIAPSSTFGWYLGFGASKISGDDIDSKWTSASTIGASYNLTVGSTASMLFGFEILSLGSGLNDASYFSHTDSAYFELSNLSQDMGYIGLEVMYRQYFNRGRNYYFELGMYGSFLVNASWEGDAVITDTLGNINSGSFQEDLVEFYKPFDYGIASGIGGRIPLGESKKWHITIGVRFYYGLQNIFDYKSFGMPEVTEANLYGLILLGVDIPTRSSD